MTRRLPHWRTRALVRRLLTVAAAATAVCGVATTGASAATPTSPAFAVHSLAVPTRFAAGDNNISNPHNQCFAESPECDAYEVTVTNTSAQPTDGSTITVTDTVPAGVSILRTQFFYEGFEEGTGSFTDRGSELCEQQAATVKCNSSEVLQPDESLKMFVFVSLDEPVVPGPLAANKASVSGGGAAVPASTESPSSISSEPPPFGVVAFSSVATDGGGTADTQAGAHPYEVRTRIDLANSIHEDSAPPPEKMASGVQDLRDVVVDLPLGFVGSALATPHCILTGLSSLHNCPPDTRVGHITTEPEGVPAADTGIYNLVPEEGAAAEFGYVDKIHGSHVLYAHVVPGPEGYVLQVTASQIPVVPLTDITTTFFGDPAVKDQSGNAAVAMFTNSSDCGAGGSATRVYVDSWSHPGRYNPDGTPDLSDPNWKTAEAESPPVTGCDMLQFEPRMYAQPDTTTTDTPTGLNFELKVPTNEETFGNATPPLKDATVVLPAGVIVNPASAGGLESCSEAQIGWPGYGGAEFTASAPTCPKASKVGSVEITSPLIGTTLTGSVYLAAQNENPLHALLAAYIVVDDPTTGVVVKLPGRLETDPATGQITGSFQENPELPFSDLKLRFFGGVRGELATPESCGTFTTTSSLLPWSAEEAAQAATPSSSFAVNSGCTPGFGPAFTAGTISPQAGGYSPFTLTFSRQDSEQELSGLTVNLPPGLLGKLAGVSQCSDAQLAAAAANPSGVAERNNPECPANSRLGSVQSAAGVGSEPYTLTGTAYLTGPYKGAPYGIAVVVPAVAGPFDLGNVVVRSTLNIDPSDAHVTVTSDPFPTVVDAKGADGHTDGFPIRLHSITVTVDRPSFTLNPTSCEPAAVTGTLTSTAGTPAAVSSRFQAVNCATLGFKPVFSASTAGQASKANGASLDVKVAYPTGPLGTYANIKTVKVDLPKQLPSRLTTLQKACVAKVFEANPAGCPSASDVGTATASTPLLSGPLVGPAYIVSHGGEAFPDLEIVLQGEGITLVLDGNTRIKGGITSSTFKAIPDAPVSAFELKLPMGKYSILSTDVPPSAHYDLCGQTLDMPTQITGQNGATIKQTTKIGVAGCAKTKALTRAQKLVKALTVCHKKKGAKRAACEKAARRQFGPIKRSKSQSGPKGKKK
jgi:uncharacterized repeat protein (TIGR01451 family)